MTIKEMYNKGIITLDQCEDLLSRTCFYRPSEYEVRLEGGYVILNIYEQVSNYELELDTHHLGI